MRAALFGASSVHTEACGNIPYNTNGKIVHGAAGGENADEYEAGGAAARGGKKAAGAKAAAAGRGQRMLTA